MHSRGRDLADADSEHNYVSGCTSRIGSVPSTGNIYSQIQTLRQLPDENIEGPPFYKNVVHVHSEMEQHRLDAAWIDKDITMGISGLNLMNVQPQQEQPNNSNNIVSPVWEQANDADEKAEKGRKARECPQIFTAASTSSASRFMKRKLRDFGREWKDGFSPHTGWRIIEAGGRVTCSNVVWCLVLGTWLQHATHGKLGITELVLTSSVCGALFQLLGGQAILIVGPSAPCLIFTVAAVTSSRRLGIDVISWMGWIGIWGSLVLLLLTLSNASKLMSNMTLFSWDVISLFLRITFLWAAIEQLVHMFTSPGFTLDSTLLSLWLATASFFVAVFLENARHCLGYGLQSGCCALADYGPLLVLVLFSAVQHLPKLLQPQVDQVSLPESGYHTDQIVRLGYIHLRVLPIWAIMLAVIPGIMLSGMIFIYQNSATDLVKDNAGSILLYKGSKKYDLCILAFLNFICSLFGLPFACTMLHESYMHTRALTVKLHEYSDMEDQRGVISKVAVQRISGVAAAVLSALLLVPTLKLVLERIPSAVLTGLMLQYACQRWGSLRFMKLIIAWIMKEKSKLRQPRVSASAICVYSAAQVSCTFVVLVVSKTPAAVMFPLFIFSTLWVRHYLMRNLFKRHDFVNLDGKLSKDFSDLSSSGQLSEVSQDMHASCSQQAWPRLTVLTETLKTGRTTATSVQDVNCVMEASKANGAAGSGSDSPVMRSMSPSLLLTNSRRLKERSRRRSYRRKMKAAVPACDDLDTSPSQDQQHTMPPLVKAIMMQESNFSPSYLYDENNVEEEINLSKRVSPRLSPQFFKRSRERGSMQDSSPGPLEVHSNLLYEPKNRNARASSKRKLVSENNDVLHNDDGDDDYQAPTVPRFNEIEDDQQKNQTEEIVSVSGGTSPSTAGIGRHVVKRNHVPPFGHQSSPTKSKPKALLLHYSKSPVHIGHARLKRSSTTRWPTTANSIYHADHQQQQLNRHSTSTTKDGIGFIV